jgi:7,8-dihydropterin-6-yl-methyl-4-(beta-D-ribofuranosyl)aminobenzene 5'-phosphate synthase
MGADIANFTITSLVDNTASLGLLGEHGLSLWIQTPSGTAILDTGQGEVLLRNAGHLSIDISQAKAIIFSHGHLDHTGGLAATVAAAQDAAIYIASSAFLPKYTRRSDGQGLFIGMSDASRQSIEQNRGRVVFTDKPMEIMPGLCVTGPVPRITDFEDTGGDFFKDQACLLRDELAEDQAVYFDTPRGLVVLIGCAHAGVVNTLLYVRQLTGGRPIDTVIGGMHLLAASEARLSRTVQAIREMDVGHIGLAHCTGFPAMARLYNNLPGRCFLWTAGSQLVID